MVAPTAAQTIRAQSMAFDAEYRFYVSDLDYDAAELSNIWAGATYTPSGDWTEITTIVTGCHFDDARHSDDGYTDWNAALRGTGYDPDLLAPEKCVLAMRRFYAAGASPTWSTWWVWWYGWINPSLAVADDYREGGEWSVPIGSLSVFTKRDMAPARRYGKTNIAEGKSAVASTELSTPLLEGGKGEFLGVADLSADQAVDGYMDTLWCSEQAPTLTADTLDTTGGGNEINEIFREPVGYGPEYRWFEVIRKATPTGTDAPHWDMLIYSKSTGYALDCWESRVANPLADVGDAVIFCADERCFRELFSAGDTPIVDWSHLRYTNEGGTEKGDAADIDWTYDPAGDVLYLTDINDDDWSDSHEIVVWGDETWAGEGWSGAAVPVWEEGHSIRRSPAGKRFAAGYSKASDFVEDSYPSPGRYHHGATDEDKQAAEDWEWISVDLDTIEWTLAAELAYTDTTAHISPNTDGLMPLGDASYRAIRIGTEILYYTGKTVDTLTGVSGMAAGDPYPVGTQIWQHEDGVATNLWKVNTVGWKRPTVIEGDSGSYSYPTDFKVFYSQSANPVYPPDKWWELDWTDAEGNQGRAACSWGPYTGTTWEAITLPRRVRHVLLAILNMSDGGRAKINELQVFPGEWTVTGGGSEYLAPGTIDGVFNYILKTCFGLPAGRVSATYNAYVGPFETAETSYHNLLTDIAKKAGLLVRYRRDGRIYIVTDPAYPLHDEPSTVYTFGRSTLRGPIQYRKNWTRLRQVHLRAFQPKQEVTFDVYYPPTAGGHGETVTIDAGHIVGSEQEAILLARHEYQKQSRSSSATLLPVGPVDDWLGILDRVYCNWDIEPDDAEIAELMLVKSISVDINMQLPQGRGDSPFYTETIECEGYVP